MGPKFKSLLRLKPWARETFTYNISVLVFKGQKSCVDILLITFFTMGDQDYLGFFSAWEADTYINTVLQGACISYACTHTHTLVIMFFLLFLPSVLSPK